MTVQYHPKHDLLYIRLDPKKQEVVNRRVDEDIVLDIGEGDRIIGIEILDASKKVDLKSFLPANYEMEEVAEQILALRVSNSFNKSTRLQVFASVCFGLSSESSLPSIRNW